MKEWQHQVGLIVPSWNTVIEYEVSRLLMPAVSVHTSRVSHTEDSEPAFSYMVSEGPAAAELLRHANVQAICYACTAASFFRGAAAEQELSKRLSENVQRPIVTMAGAIVSALRALGAERVCVGAPYERWLLDRLTTFLEESGFDVVNSSGLSQQANVLHAPSKAMDLARQAWRTGSDALVISCGNFRTLEYLDAVEGEIGRPVVASNQASAWALLKALPGRSAAISGAGALMRTLS